MRRRDLLMEEYYVKEAAAYMRYQDLPGEDTPILFVHGLGCAGSFDYPQVAAQSELSKHRCILVDLLGAGYSDKPESFEYSVHAHAVYLKNFVDSLGLTKFAVFGHSLGGAVAIELTAMSTQNVTCLVLSEANLDPSTDGSSSYKIASYSEEHFINTGFNDIILESLQDGNTMWASTLANWSPVAAYRFSKSAHQGGNPSWRKIIYELPASKGFIFGESSLPDDDYLQMIQHGIHVSVVPHAGHSMAWENPKGLSLAISQCLTL